MYQLQLLHRPLIHFLLASALVRGAGSGTWPEVVPILGATSATSKLPILATGAMVPVPTCILARAPEAPTGLRLSVRGRIRVPEVLHVGPTDASTVAASGPLHEGRPTVVVVVPRRPSSVAILRSRAVPGTAATRLALQAVVPIVQEVQAIPFLTPAATEVVAPNEEVPAVLTGIGLPSLD